MTQIREATQESVTTAENAALKPEFVYCNLHGWVKTGFGICGMGHELKVKTDEGVEVDYCCFEGGYELVEPPDTHPDGDWAAQDLDEDEKAQAELRETGEWLNV